MEKKDIDNLLEDITGCGIQETIDSVFCGLLTEKVEEGKRRYVADNIKNLAVETYLEMSKEYGQFQEQIDQSFIKSVRSDFERLGESEF